MIQLVLALRGAAAVVVLSTLVGGLPRIVQAGLAVAAGAWAALLAGQAVPPGGPWALLAGQAVPPDELWAVAARELVIGATIGVIAALPLLAAAIAGRLVDRSVGARTRGSYGALFGVLAAAVFVGIDGHVAFVEAIAKSFREVPAITATEPRVVEGLGRLVPVAVKLAIPWLVTAAVVEIAAGVAVRIAGRAATHGPIGAATPAALVMMTASLVGTLAVAIATLVR